MTAVVGNAVEIATILPMAESLVSYDSGNKGHALYNYMSFSRPTHSNVTFSVVLYSFYLLNLR